MEQCQNLGTVPSSPAARSAHGLEVSGHTTTVSQCGCILSYAFLTSKRDYAVGSTYQKTKIHLAFLERIAEGCL